MEVSTSFVILVPIVVGVVQAIKKTGLSTRWSPLVSIGLGVIGAVLISNGFSFSAVVQGVVAGLTAAGLWSGTRATFGN